MRFDGWTVVFQAVNFVVLVWLLHRFLYRPVLGIMERRRAEGERLLEEARRARQTAEAERAGLEAERGALALEREGVLESARREAQAERGELLEKARREAAALSELAGRRIEAEREATATSLKSEALDLALGLAEQLLRNVRSPAVAERFLSEAVNGLRGLAAKRASALALGEGTLRVVTAPALEAAAQARWRQELSGALGGVPVEFSEDDSLIAGAELHFPRGVLGGSWARTLERLRKELGGNGAQPA